MQAFRLQFVLFTMIFLGGCTTQAWYEGFKTGAENECYKLPPVDEFQYFVNAATASRRPVSAECAGAMERNGGTSAQWGVILLTHCLQLGDKTVHLGQKLFAADMWLRGEHST